MRMRYRKEGNQMPKMIRWSHPEFETTLILHPEDPAKEIFKDLMGEDFDMALLESKEVEMTQAEMDNLREWDG